LRKKAGDPCPYCKKTLSKQLFIDRELARGAAIKAALAVSDLRGRPRSIDYTMVKILRGRGLSISEIMEKLGVGRGVVQHAIRITGS